MDENEINPTNEELIQQDEANLSVVTSEELLSMQKGPKGFQNEPGFQVLEDGFIMLPVLKCASDKTPTPQWRYVSLFELGRKDEHGEPAPQLEVANHLFCVRVKGVLVVGRRDDLKEAARKVGTKRLRGVVRKLTAEGLGKVFGFLGRVIRLITELTDKIK